MFALFKRKCSHLEGTTLALKNQRLFLDVSSGPSWPSFPRKSSHLGGTTFAPSLKNKQSKIIAKSEQGLRLPFSKEIAHF